jgi:hypothetical protein
MQLIENQVASGKTIALDEHHFVNCTFTNCDLVYSGGDWAWANTKFENCRFSFSGSASRTVALLGNLGLIKPGPFGPQTPPKAKPQ